MPRECRVSRSVSEKVDARCDRRVAELAGQQWGVVSVAQMLECGLSYDAIRARKRTGRLHELHRGVLAVGHANPPWQGRMLAAGLACGPDAVVSHHSAAALWGFIDYNGDRHPEVTVVGTSTRTHRGIRVHRTSMLVSRDRSRAQGVPVTATARTLVDLAATLDASSLRSAVRRAQGQKLVNLRQLNEVLVRLGPRRGSGRLSRLIATGPAPTRSVLEDVVLDLLLDAGFEHPEVNKPLVVGGRRIIPDFRWPKQRLILEADGSAWHDDALAREDDAERQAVLEAHGERVIRITWHQAIARRTESIRRIREAGAPAARRASSFSI